MDTKDQICQYNPSYNSANVTGIIDIAHDSERALMDAVAAVGPVSVAIDASLSFQFYQSGKLLIKMDLTQKKCLSPHAFVLLSLFYYV